MCLIAEVTFGDFDGSQTFGLLLASTAVSGLSGSPPP